jgi:CDP-paratose 2-epimerase
METIEYGETDTRYFAVGYENGFDENVPLHFESPYGCSKGAMDQYMLDYSRMFGIKSVVFRHSSIVGGRQFSTVDQGWVGWFCKVANDIKNGTLKQFFDISGNGKQVRDVLFAPDLVSCYFGAVESINKTAGNVYNIGGGVSNSLSLIELFYLLENNLGISMKYNMLPKRQSDQRVFIANTQKAFEHFNWSPTISKEKGVKDMLQWVSSD